MTTNDPEYFLVDSIGSIVEAARVEMALPVLHYRYGYLRELNSTLSQMEESTAELEKKYPLVWVLQPFTIQRGLPGLYGRAIDLRLFIINHSDKEWKANERMINNFKTVLYPIYRQLLNQVNLSPIFSTMGVESIKHRLVDRYWIKDIGLDDTVDCLELNSMELDINESQNCLPYSNQF